MNIDKFIESLTEEEKKELIFKLTFKASKRVVCIANEHTEWMEWYEKRNMIPDEQDLLYRHKATLTIGKEYKVIKIDTKGGIVIADDFGKIQRRSKRYFKNAK